ncbi:hypothetical protein CPB86DRAFT_328676 [Serendipita vermifera]|nr:hypothetical protein CPB86DRAFT_328676 [Serendipita vermifera]
MTLSLDKSVLSDKVELERYLQQLPEGGEFITFHGDTKDLRDYESPEIFNAWNSKPSGTLFFIDCHPKNSPIQFRRLTAEEKKSLPNPMASTYSRAAKMMKTASNIKGCSFQATHLSRALLHLVISLWDVMRPEKNIPDPNKLDRWSQLDA